MKLPRGVSGDELAKALAAILDDVAAHFELSRGELLLRINI